MKCYHKFIHKDHATGKRTRNILYSNFKISLSKCSYYYMEQQIIEFLYIKSITIRLKAFKQSWPPCYTTFHYDAK